MDREVRIKERDRGLSASEMACLWACGGERCEDFERMREDEGLTELIGHKFPAPQTARDFLERFEAEESLPLWKGSRCVVYEETKPLEGLDKVRTEIVSFVQGLRPRRRATLDIDATMRTNLVQRPYPRLRMLRG